MKTAGLILAAILSGCETARPWEHAPIGCLQYANAACIVAAATPNVEAAR